MKKTTKWILIIITILSMVGYTVYEVIKPVTAELITVQQQSVTVSFKEKGTIKATNERTIYAETMAKIVNVNVKEGQKISKGDKLFVLDDKELNLELIALEAQKENVLSQKQKALKDIETQINQQVLQISETKRQLSVYKKEYEKTKALYENNSVSKTEYELSESLVKQYESILKQQEAAVSALREQYSGNSSETIQFFNTQITAIEKQTDRIKYEISKCQIFSPVDGTIGNVEAKVGMFTSVQIPLCKIIEPGSKKLEVYILTEDIRDIKVGMNVKLKLEGKIKDEELQGVVSFIAPVAEEKVSSLGIIEKRIRVDIISEALNQMYEGSELQVEFVVLEEQNKLLIPKTAIFKVDNENMLWVVNNGKAEQRKIVKGIETDIEVVVEQGINENDVVIKNPNIEGLAEGKRVAGK